MIRDAKPSDRLKGTAAYGQFVKVSEEDGEVTGVVSCSVVGRDVFFHDIEYWGDQSWLAAALMRRGMRWCDAQARRLGSESYFANVQVGASNVFDMCQRLGEIHQVVFKIGVR